MKGNKLLKYLQDDTSLAVLTYFCDIFTALNKTNKIMQGSNTTMFTTMDKLNSLKEILNLWSRQVAEEKYSQFKTLDDFLIGKGIELKIEIKQEILDHLKTLLKEIDDWFDKRNQTYKNEKMDTIPFLSKIIRFDTG